MNAHLFLDTSRRSLIRFLSLAILMMSLVLLIVLIIVQFTYAGQNDLTIVMTGAILFAALGGGLSLFLVRDRPLWQAVLPLVVMMISENLITAFYLPENSTVAAAFCTVAVVLAGLSNQRVLTFITGITCLLLSVMMVIATPAPIPVESAISLGAFRLPLQVMIIGSLIVIVWFIVDRLLVMQAAAIAVADQRTHEANAARAEAETHQAAVEARNAEQQRLLDLVQTLELPIMPVGQGALLVPLVGSLDSRRLAALRQAVLARVASERATTVIFDVTGVTILDTTVARELIQTAQAIILLGAQPLVSGIRASVAQTLVSLGVDLSDLHPVHNLGQGLARIAQATSNSANHH